MSRPRITKQHLLKQIENLNYVTGSPKEAIANEKFRPGHYSLCHQNGGYSLSQITSINGSEQDIFACGQVPARDLSNRITAYLYGRYDERKVNEKRNQAK